MHKMGGKWAGICFFRFDLASWSDERQKTSLGMNEHALREEWEGKLSIWVCWALFDEGLVWGLILQDLIRALIAWLGYEVMTRILFEGFFRSTLCWHLASGWIDELSASRIMKTLLPSTLVFDMHVTCLESQSHESPARPANFLLGFQECICNSNFGTYDTCSRMNWVHMLPSTVRGKTNTLSRGLGKKRGRISFNHSASRAHYLPLHLPPSLLAPVFAWVLSSPSKDHTQPPSSFCTGDGGSKRVIIFEKVEVGALSLTELWIENGGTVAEAGRVEFIHPCYVCRRLSLSDLEAQPFKQFSSHLLSCLSDLLCSLNPQFLLLLLLRSIVLNLCRFLASS